MSDQKVESRLRLPPPGRERHRPDVGAASSRENHLYFDRLHESAERHLRRALVAAYGREVGNEATDEAFAWAWENLDKVETLSNPAGYLFRVGQSAARKLRRAAPQVATPLWAEPPDLNPELPRALGALTDRQRAAVVLHHGYALTYAEVGRVLGVSPSSVQNHVVRGTKKLIRLLEEREHE